MASYSDSFTYSDGQLSTVSSGVWVNRNASIDVISGQFYENSAATLNGWSEVNTSTANFADDHESQIAVPTFNTFDAIGPVVRSSASGCYCISVDGTAGSTRRVCRMDGTTKVVIGTVNITPAANDTLKIRAVGSTITAYVNGSLVDTITDSTYSTGQPGIFYNRGGSGGSRGDTFSAADITSGLTITSVTPSSFDSGIAGIVIAGSGFGASQGSSTVDIGGQAQTVTAWGDTSITITSARGSNSMGAGQLKVTIR